MYKQSWDTGYYHRLKVYLIIMSKIYLICDLHNPDSIERRFLNAIMPRIPYVIVNLVLHWIFIHFHDKSHDSFFEVLVAKQERQLIRFKDNINGKNVLELQIIITEN